MQFDIIRATGSTPPDKTGRISWPWKDMGVGDAVVIPDSLKGKAQTSVHVYGRTCGKKFTTKSERNGLLVERIA